MAQRAISACLAEDCEEKPRGRGLCELHYQRAWRAGELGDNLIRPRPSLVRDDMGRKQCRGCLEWLDEGMFYRPRSPKPNPKKAYDGLTSECKTCLRARKMGITAAAVLELLQQQKFKCAICRKRFDDGKFDIDHDHSCCPGQKACGNCIRGLLCRGCNVALGNLKDGRDMRLLLRLVDYVEKGRQARLLDQCSRRWGQK